MAMDEPEDKSKWILPPIPEHERARRRRMDEKRERDEADRYNRLQESRRMREERLVSLRETCARFMEKWNRETV